MQPSLRLNRKSQTAHDSPITCHLSLLAGGYFVSYRFVRFAAPRLAIAVTLCLSLFASVYAYEQAADEAALRSLTENFFAAYAKQDLDALMALWSDKSPDFAASKQSLQQSFAANRIEIKATTMGKLNVDGDKANLRVLVDSSAVDIKTNEPAKGFGRLNRSLHFVKEGGVWKVARYVSSEEELTMALAAAKSDEERNSLFEANKELQTLELERVMIAQAIRLMNQGSYPQAMGLFQLGLSLAQELGDKTSMVVILRNIGGIHRLQGRYPQAMDYLQQSLKIAEEIGDKLGQSGTLIGIGNAYTVQGNLAKGLEYNFRSLTIKEEIGDKPGAAMALASIGSAYQFQGNYAESLKFQHRGLTIREEIGDKPGVAVSLGNIAIVYQLQGHYEQALEYHQRSLKIREEIGDKPGISQTYNNMGLMLRAQGNYPLAIDYYQRSLKIKEELGDKTGTGSSLGNLGLVHFAQGNLAQALDYHQRSLKIAQEIKNKIGIASSLNNIGLIHHTLNNYTEALDYYQQSLKIKEEIPDKAGVGVTLNNLGTIYEWQGDYAKALEYHQRSLKIKEEMGDQATLAAPLQGIGMVKKSQGHYTEALEFFGKAAVAARQVGDLEQLLQVRTIAGQVHRTLNQPDLAKQAFADAIRATEDLRNQVAGAAQQRQQFFETKLSPYYEMVDLLSAQNNFQEALAFAERSKGRALFDVLSRGKGNVTKAMSGAEQRQEATLNAELVVLNSQVRTEKLRPKPDAALLTELTAKLEKSRLQMEAFQTNLYAIHPELRVQRGEIRPITSTEAAALIPDSKTALLEFVVRENQALLFVLSQNLRPAAEARLDLQVYKINIKQKELVELTRRFNQRITSRSLGFQEPATQLFNLLLKPAQAQLRGLNNLVIVPDGVLWELPFQALLSAPKRFLLEQYAISYAPSLTVLREMNSLQIKRRKGNPQVNTLLAFGNPSFGTATAEKVAATFMNEKLLPLPEAERQVKVLEKIYGSKNSTVYTGSEASEERLKQQASHFQILHLATHGILNDASPMYSHLVLSQPQDKAADDGLLEAWEIMKLDLQADLVILSACDTARGKVGAGEGVIGLAWSLFVAGCPTTVVSQWKVETESNSEFMIAFHKNLRLSPAQGKASGNKAEALRQAALKLRRNRQYQHPFYWAAFVIIGDAN
jgi:CHAT domain-containing protein/Tfp pilus assembly protein PilF